MCHNSYRVVIFADYEEQLRAAEPDMPINVGAIVNDPIQGAYSFIPLFIVKGVDSLMFYNVGYRNLPQKYIQHAEQTITIQDVSQICVSFLETWYGIQIALLHPNVRDVFRHPRTTIDKISSIGSGGKRKNRVKYIKERIVNSADLEMAIFGGDKSHTRHALVWYVIGHWREYVNGVKTFVKFAYSHHATDPACGRLLNAFDLVRIHKFGDDDEKKSFNQMIEMALADNEVKTQLARERMEQADADFTDADDWQKALELDKQGRVKDTLDNLVIILRHDEALQHIAFNCHRDGIDAKGGLPWTQLKDGWNDSDNAALKVYLSNHYGVYSPTKTKDAVLAVAAEKAYHPIKDYLESLSAAERQRYDKLKRALVLDLPAGCVTAANAAALSGKLCQMANGAVYTDAGDVIPVHDQKLDALEDIIEAAGSKPLLVAYWFKHDLARISERLQKLHVPFARLDTAESIRRWNNGELPVALIHPASAGHGLNLQSGGSCIVWFGLTWSLELYQQTNARLWRQGQNAETVVVQHIVVKDTIDERILKALSKKDSTQAALIDAVKADLQA